MRDMFDWLLSKFNDLRGLELHEVLLLLYRGNCDLG